MVFNNKNYGFTLLEVLASLTIISIMTVMVYTTIAVTRKNQIVNEIAMKQNGLIRNALNTLNKDLSMAYISLGESLMTEAGGMGEDASSEYKKTFFKYEAVKNGIHLVFSTFSHIRTRKDAKESDSCLVEYMVVEDAKNPGKMVLRRRETHRLDNKPPEEIPGEVWDILPGIQSLEFQFYKRFNDSGPEGFTGEWVDEWDTTAIDGELNKLPTHIKIHLVVDSGRGLLLHYHLMVKTRLYDAINLTPSSAPVTKTKKTKP
jgi:prepilin-type N-terminal cleavage/methylation domain-containing protein